MQWWGTSRTEAPALIFRRDLPLSGDGASPVSTNGRSAYLFFLGCPNPCPSRPLRCCYSLASCSRNRSFLVSSHPPMLAPMQEDFPEGSKGGGHAAKFLLKSRTFLLKLFDYGLN